MREPAIVLRPMTTDDLESVIRWSRDDDFCRANGWNVGQLPEEVRTPWTRLLEQPLDNFVRFGVEVRGTLVGYVDLADIRHGEAELGIAIGDSSRWGEGLGAAAAAAILRYAFEQLGLNQIRASTVETNVRSVGLLEKLGFRRVGTLSRRDESLREQADVIRFTLAR